MSIKTWTTESAKLLSACFFLKKKKKKKKRKRCSRLVKNNSIQKSYRQIKIIRFICLFGIMLTVKPYTWWYFKNKRNIVKYTFKHFSDIDECASTPCMYGNDCIQDNPTATSVCAVRDLKVSTVKEVCSMIFLR